MANKLLFYDKVFFLFIFLVLLLLNYNCLHNPPHWDNIVGLHNQAIWLAKNNFDYGKLYQEGQQFWHGGSNIYPYAVMPVIYGILYKCCTPYAVHYLGHVFNILCLAAACTLSYVIMLRYSRDKLSAILWSFAALSEPVMAGRTAALGQECPLIAFMVLILFMLSRQKILLASLLCFLVILIKLTGGIMAIALTCWIIFFFIIRKVNKSSFVLKEDLKIPASILVFTTIASIFLLSISNQVSQSAYSTPDLSVVTRKIIYEFTVNLPVQGLYILVGLFLLGINVYIYIWRRNNKSLSRRNSLIVYLLIFISEFYLAFINIGTLPRYSGCIIFPFVILLCLLSYNIHLSRILASGFLLLGLMMMHGKFHPGLPSHLARSGEYLERSREYLVDLNLNLELCCLLEKNCRKKPVAAKWPYVQMLTMPEMRYVNKPLQNVYCTCIHPKYTSAKVIPEGGLFPPETIFLFAPVTYEYWLEFGIPMYPAKEDEILYMQQKLSGCLVLYRRKNFKSSLYNKSSSLKK